MEALCRFERGGTNGNGRLAMLFAVTTVQVMRQSAHYSEGNIPVAFIFSAPGEKESRMGRPVAGDTGTNLDLALVHLKAACPELFPSAQRYDYRITNAWPEPIARSRGDRSSEARDTQIRDGRNVQRVLRELHGCKLVVLSGGKAKLLTKILGDSGKSVVTAPHVGNKGLNGTYAAAAFAELPSARARKERRIELWARAVKDGAAREGYC
jgi:uracil-DNA glycosylase